MTDSEPAPEFRRLGPDHLVGDRTDVGGRFRRATPDDWAALQTVHEAHARDRTLALRRDEA